MDTRRLYDRWKVCQTSVLVSSKFLINLGRQREPFFFGFSPSCLTYHSKDCIVFDIYYFSELSSCPPPPIANNNFFEKNEFIINCSLYLPFYFVYSSSNWYWPLKHFSGQLWQKVKSPKNLGKKLYTYTNTFQNEVQYV